MKLSPLRIWFQYWPGIGEDVGVLPPRPSPTITPPVPGRATAARSLVQDEGPLVDDCIAGSIVLVVPERVRVLLPTL